MLRDRGLVPLSHQHHNGLALCVLTDRSLANDASADNIAKLANRIIDRYEIELTNHFELEETVLFPALPQCKLVEQLIDEHRQITRIVDSLRAKPRPDDLNRFTALLRRHIRTEETELFEHAQKVLSRKQLDDIGELLDQRATRVCL